MPKYWFQFWPWCGSSSLSSVLSACSFGCGAGFGALLRATAPPLPPLALVLLSEQWRYKFCAVVPPLKPRIASFHTFLVKSHHGRSGMLPVFSFDFQDRFLYAMLYPSWGSPLSEIPVYGFPSEKVVWEHSPLTATDQQIKNGLKDTGQGIFAVPAIIFKEYFGYIRSLVRGPMCLIEVYFNHI